MNTNPESQSITEAMKLKSLLILLMLCCSTMAQTQPTEAQLKLQRQRAQAVAMIEQTAIDATLWDDKKSAVEVLATSADLLWNEAPARSGKWLTRAWELIDQVAETAQDDTLREFVRTSSRSPLQSLVLRVAYTHDPKLAENFIQQLAQSQPPEKKERGAFDDRSARSEQFLRLAQQSVNTNPELAFALAKQSLVDGVSFTLQNVLTSLRKKNVALSNQLFDLAMARFTTGFPEPSEAEILAGYLFQPGMTFSSSSTGQVIMSMNPMQRGEPPVAQTEPQRAHSFLVAAYQAFLNRPILLDTAAARSRAQQIWVFGSRNVRRYETIAPEFFVPAKTYLAQLEQQLFPTGRGDPFANKTNDSRGASTSSERDAYEARIQTLEELAEKTADPTAKRRAYIDAVLAADAQDYERAKRVAEKIDDDILRSETIAFIFYRAALYFVGNKDLEKASELIGKIEDAQRRSIVRIAIAHSLLRSRGDVQGGPDEGKVSEQRAFDLLNDIEKDLRKEDPSANIGRILLARAALLSMVDQQQTLFGLQQALQVINKLDRFDLKDPVAPRLGISGSPRSESLPDAPRVGFTFRSATESIVQSQFDELAELAGSFRVKEVRGIARVEVARLFLEKTAPSPR
jgi:hypothetical protein